MTNSESIINAATEAHNQLLDIKPVIKTFIIAIVTNFGIPEYIVRAESLSQAESNLMRFYGVSSATFPDSRQIFS